MTDTGTDARGLAADCMVETAEGPVRMADTPKRGFAVLTRLPSGALGFRQLIRVETRSGPLLRVALDNGQTILTAPGHPFHRDDGQIVPAERLAPGALLATAFHYPEGYVPPDATTAVERPQVAVRTVEAAGEGEVLFGTVRDTHVLFLTAGVLCGE